MTTARDDFVKAAENLLDSIVRTHSPEQENTLEAVGALIEYASDDDVWMS